MNSFPVMRKYVKILWDVELRNIKNPDLDIILGKQREIGGNRCG